MPFLPSFFNTVQLLCHIYLFWNLRRAFGAGRWQYIAGTFLFICFLMVAFRPEIAIHFARPSLTRGILHWAGFMIICTMWSGGRDMAHLLLRAIDRVAGSALSRRVSTAASVRLALACGVLAFGYSLYEAATIRVSHLTVATPRLPSGTDRVRIVAVADMHIVRHTSADWVESVALLINAQHPDIVVLLGDIADDRLETHPELATALRAIAAPHGKFAILGNHEQYRGVEQSTTFLESAGFAVLRGEVRVVDGIALAGVDDPIIRDRRSIAETLDDAPEDSFILLLAHRPETPSTAHSRFDMQLSGHTHGGQIWPLALVSRLRHGYWSGATPLPGKEDGGGRPGMLYISRGTGTKGPPLRFLAPPEITVVDIVRQ